MIIAGKIKPLTGYHKTLVNVSVLPQKLIGVMAMRKGQAKMTINRYRSDNIYKDAVLKFYVLAWFGGLGIVVVAATTILIIWGRDCLSLRWAIAGLPAIHIISWLVIANLMCGTFQAMSYYGEAKAPPTPEDDGREIPITKGVKKGAVTWE